MNPWYGPDQDRPGSEAKRFASAVVVASLTDSNGQTWQFGYDLEMDVKNNN